MAVTESVLLLESVRVVAGGRGGAVIVIQILRTKMQFW